jgi:hypothetical protein
MSHFLRNKITFRNALSNWTNTYLKNNLEVFHRDRKRNVSKIFDFLLLLVHKCMTYNYCNNTGFNISGMSRNAYVYIYIYTHTHSSTLYSYIYMCVYIHIAILRICVS